MTATQGAGSKTLGPRQHGVALDDTIHVKLWAMTLEGILRNNGQPLTTEELERARKLAQAIIDNTQAIKSLLDRPTRKIS